MKIDLEDLEKATVIILQNLKELQKNRELTKDLYWEIDGDERYDPYKNPKSITLGSLFDDWEHIQKIAKGKNDPIPYAIVWLAAIYRYLGEVDSQVLPHAKD